MKNKLPRNIFLQVIGLLLICALATIVEMQFKIVQRGYDNFVLDNRNHYLPCQDLPTKIEVERIVAQHEEIIQQIQQIAPGFIGIEIDSSNCEGKADLLIWYGTHQQRIAVEKLMSADTFFGIPYRLQNR
jgi:hypothetical protein